MNASLRSRFGRVAVVVALAAVGLTVTEAPASADSYVTWGAFPYPSSEDYVTVAESPNSVPAGQLQICLQSAGDVTWWKGVDERGYNGGTIHGVFTKDANHGVNCMTFNLDEVSYLELGKAKFFGVHTDMYRLPKDQLLVKNGSTITFNWLRDH